MVRSFANRVLSLAILVSLAITLTAVEQSALGADSGGWRMSGRRHRLPLHYAQVVTEEQKQKILKIQDEYQPKIEALEKERDAKIAALLTPEQKQKIEEVSGKAKREKAAKPVGDAAPAPAAESKPAK
jgi:Spy/CpxP family protein refolding chaperone